MDRVRTLLTMLGNVLQGEPARFIGYGAGLVVYAVAKLVGAIPDIPLEQAIAGAVAYTAIVASVVESVRHFVYSPRSAQDLMDIIDELQQEVEDLRNVTGREVPSPDST